MHGCRRAGASTLGALLTALVALPAAAAEPRGEPICADRPGKATAVCTVPAGRLQLETGLADWTLDRQSGDRESLLVIGETTLKYGLTDASDFEVDVVPWQRSKVRVNGARESDSGFGDVALLYKQRLTSDGAPLQVALLPSVKFPTAKRSLGNGKVEVGFVVPVQYAIPRTSLGITLSPELDWLADDDGSGHHLTMAQVASLGWQVTDKVNVAAELWRQWNWDPDGTRKQASFDVMAAYLARNDLQLDLGGHFGSTAARPMRSCTQASPKHSEEVVRPASPKYTPE